MPQIVPASYQDPLPRSDSDLSLFATNFGQRWAVVTWGVTLPLPATIATAAATFASALATASNPSGRTSVTIAAKNAARVALVTILRGAIRSANAAYAAKLATATASALTDLGIRVPDTTRTAIPTPGHSPLIAFVATRPGELDLRVTQTDTAGGSLTNRAYLPGYAGAEVLVTQGSTTVPFRRKRVNITIPTALNGLSAGTANVKARYVTNTGLTGPWSDSVTVAIV